MTAFDIAPALQEFVALLLNGLLPGVLVTLFVWLALRLFRFNATTRYAIWFATLLLVASLPLLASLELSSLRSVGTEGVAVAPTAATLPLAETPPATGTQAQPLPVPTPGSPDTTTAAAAARSALPAVQPAQVPELLIWFLFGAYLMGAGILLLQLFVGVLGLERLKLKSRPLALPEGFRELLHAGTRTVELRRSERITVPLAAGLFRPTILIPDDLTDQLGPAELEHIVLHELAHLARRDDWSKFVQLLLRALLFFHPAVHAIAWQLDLTREIASDDWVIARRGRGRRDYAASLVRLVDLALHRKRMRQPQIEGSAVLVRTQLERRIRLLLDRSRDISERFAAGRFLAAVVATVVAATLLAQVTLFAIAQIAGRPVITLDNAAEVEHLAEVEVFDWVGTVAFLPDGSALISDRGDETFAYWSSEDLTPLGEPLPSGVGWPTSTTVSPDGTVVVTGGEGGDIQLWNAATREPMGAPIQHTGRLSNIAFSPDGSQLASLGFDHVLKVWDVATGTELASVELDGHGNWSCEVAYSPDGRLLATSGENGLVHIWNAESFESIATLDSDSFGWSCSKAFSPDGSVLATGTSTSGHLVLWDTGSWEMIGEPIDAHRGVNFFALAFSPDGSVLASGGSNGMRLWNVATGEPLGGTMLPGRMGEKYMSSVSSIAFSPDGTLLAVGMGTSSVGGEVHLWALPLPE